MADAQDEDGGTKTLQTVTRAMGILELISRDGPLNVTSISRAIGISRSATLRILKTLIVSGHIAKPPNARTYFLTERILTLSSGYTRNNILATVTEPIIREASQRLLWPLVLTVPVGPEMLVLVTTEPDSPLALQRMTAGYRMALSDTASARVVLAQSRPEVCDEYLTFVRESPDTAPQAGAFEDGVMRARKDGFALHQVQGAREKSLAVAIRTDDIAVAGLTARFIASALTDSKAQSDVLPVLQTIASRISDALASAATTS
jgi:IclR family transcriptional regulator, mhp operon transcriptional activator